MPYTTSPVQPLTLKNSPVEFVLAGPSGKHRGVLVRSDNADLSLVGAAASASESLHLESRPEISRVLLDRQPGILAVQSPPLQNIEPSNLDFRQADYSFVWRGFATEKETRRIAKELAHRAADLRDALQEQSGIEVEWHLAPIIALCDSATSAHRRQARVLVWGVPLFFLAFAITLTIAIIVTAIEP